MLLRPMDILTQFPVRKRKHQKQLFRAAVSSYSEKIGYTATEEKGFFGVRNLVLGDPKTAKYLVTAHYDTCAGMPFPNLVTPCNVCYYVAYQVLVVLMIGIAAIICGLCAGLLFGGSAVKFAISAAYFCLLMLIIFGPANRENANDNTSGIVTLLEIARTLPENQRHKVCFVLFDLEEAGLLGSSSYRRKHKKETGDQLVINLDCVGDGDHLMMFPTKKLRRNRQKITSLYRACGYFGNKSLLVHEKANGIYPSDQNSFPYGVGICALHKKRKIFYLSRIHTKKDKILEETNVNILRAALTTFICCDEVN